MTANRARLILDCDPGLDDAIAIALALRHSDVIGISTVGGNVDLKATTANALALCDLLGADSVPVHAGHDMPLSGSVKHRAAEFHGPRGTGTVVLPESPRPAASNDAVQWIIDTVRAEDDLWLVATGPLTNVADAFQKAPDIVSRLRGISWMGGSCSTGNTTPAAEFNCWVDPEAADIVFRSGHPNLSMLGLHVTRTVFLDRRWIDDLQTETEGQPGAVFAKLLDYYESQQRLLTTLPGAVMHDALAVVQVTHPHLLAGVRRPTEVVLSDGPARGMTIVDKRPTRNLGPANVNVVEWADVEAIRDLIWATLTDK